MEDVETLEIALKHPRGAIRETTVDLQEGDSALGWNFRAWINLAGRDISLPVAVR